MNTEHQNQNQKQDVPTAGTPASNDSSRDPRQETRVAPGGTPEDKRKQDADPADKPSPKTE